MEAIDTRGSLVEAVRKRMQAGRRASARNRKGGSGHNAPLTLMLSPRCASPRISSAPEMVSDVPPPPLAESSSFSSLETAS